MKKIKKFFVRNKAISIIALVALGISITYIITYRLPLFTENERLYLWINDLSIGYIAAYIFYIVQVYLKGENDNKKFLEVTRSSFTELIKYIDVALLVCDKHIEFKDKGADLIWNGEGEEEKIYINYTCGESKALHCKSYTKQEILHLSEKFKSKLQEIKSNPIINYCDFDILEILTEIEEKNPFKTIQKVIDYADTEIDLRNCKKLFNTMADLNLKLKGKCNIHDDYHLKPVDDFTRYLADLPRTNLKNELRSIDDFKNKTLALRLQRRIFEKFNVNLPLKDIEELINKSEREHDF